jgi:hypothetical protein
MASLESVTWVEVELKSENTSCCCFPIAAAMYHDLESGPGQSRERYTHRTRPAPVVANTEAENMPVGPPRIASLAARTATPAASTVELVFAVQ